MYIFYLTGHYVYEVYTEYINGSISSTQTDESENTEIQFPGNYTSVEVPSNSDTFTSTTISIELPFNQSRNTLAKKFSSFQPVGFN